VSCIPQSPADNNSQEEEFLGSRPSPAHEYYEGWGWLSPEEALYGPGWEQDPRWGLVEPANPLDPSLWRTNRVCRGVAPKQEMLVERLFPRDVVGSVIGWGGVGKTLLGLDVMLQTARAGVAKQDQKVLGSVIPASSGGAAAMVTMEDSMDEIHRRLECLDSTRERERLPLYVYSTLDIDPGVLDPVMVREVGQHRAELTKFGQHGLEELIRNVNANAMMSYGLRLSVLFIDPAGDLVDGDENSPNAVQKLMRKLAELAYRYNITVILLGHVPKDGDGRTQRGTVAWTFKGRFTYSLKAAKKKDGRLSGRLVKANHAGAVIDEDTFFMRGKDGRLRPFILVDEDDVGEEELLADAICNAAILFTRTGSTGVAERRAELPPPLNKAGRDKLRDMVNALVKDGRLVVGEGGFLRAGR
jgi:hypothetical protein